MRKFGTERLIRPSLGDKLQNYVLLTSNDPKLKKSRSRRCLLYRSVKPKQYCPSDVRTLPTP